MIKITDRMIEELKTTVSLNIPKQLNIIAGRNGIGKSLLFDRISGIHRCRKNVIQGNENIVYLNQNIYFSDRLKVKELVKFVYRLDGKGNYSQKYEHFLKRYQTSLEHSIMERLFGHLSGGEKKLVYSTVVLSLDRDWYILDEPFAAVDDEGKALLKAIILDKVKQGKGILLSTHEQMDFGEVDVNTINLEEIYGLSKEICGPNSVGLDSLT